MSRRHQKVHHKPSGSAARPATSGALGLKAFHAANYSEAIRLWNEMGPENSPAVRTALAEAHFRRAVTARPGQVEPVAEMRRAVDLAPGEARYWFQLGLMLHRADHLGEARQAYARAADLGLSRRGVGFVRGLAELEAAPTLSLASLPWLTPDARALLEPISALLRREPLAAVAALANAGTPAASGVGDPTASLWRGLALLAAGDAAAARAALAPPQGQRLPLGAEAARAFYHGLATALSGDTQGALTAWIELARAGRSAPPFPRLQDSISRLSAQRVVELQNAGQWAAALAQAQSVLARSPGDVWLLQAALIAANRLAEAAREAGDWPGAVVHWQTLRTLLEAHPGFGPLPPVLHNLAIAHEAAEQWEPAAQAWAALLSTMPRRRGRAAKSPTADAEDALLDAKRTWLRGRILDNYKRAGKPDEAITYYKQAVKSDPENLAIRLDLAAALIANEQTIAGRNEIQRILDRDPQHIDALLLQAQMHLDREEGDAAEMSLRGVLEIDPKHNTALHGIAHLLAERGVEAFNNNQYSLARSLYLQALKYTPDDHQLLVFLGDTEITLGRIEEGKAHLDAALATGQPRAYVKVFALWAAEKKEAEARDVLVRAESAGAATPAFYLDAGVACLTRTRPPTLDSPMAKPKKVKTPKPWEEWGHALIKQGLDASPDRAEALDQLVESIGPPYADIAVEYARELLALQPEELDNYLTLAMLQGVLGNITEGQKTLDRAMQAARKQGRRDMIDKFVTLRRDLGSPMFGMLMALAAAGVSPPFDLDDED